MSINIQFFYVIIAPFRPFTFALIFFSLCIASATYKDAAHAQGVTRWEHPNSLPRPIAGVYAIDLSPSSEQATIPESRLGDWENVGIPGGIPEIAVGANVLDFGALPDDQLDDSSAFIAAIDTVKGTANNAILIPAGTYLIKAKLLIDDSVVLRGEGPDRTHLKFEVNDNGIEVVTHQKGHWIDVVGELQKGATTITVADGSGFSAGDFFEVQQENDPVTMYTNPLWEQDWAAQAVGQFGVIQSVDGNDLTLREPLNINFSSSLLPQVRTQGLVEYVGIEDLHIDRSDDPSSAGHSVYLLNTAYTWMSRVHSEWTTRIHLSTETIYRCEVRDSYFHHSQSYGGGGYGYGVEFGKHVTGCLIENNIFHTLRHAMTVHIGANNNVFGYNYSYDSRDQDGNLLPDIALHGHYPFANLFEGNIVEEIGHGDYWGPAGPHNTSLRNCVTKEGLWYEDYSSGQNIIGNELTAAPGNFIGLHNQGAATDFLIHGNYFHATGEIEWDPTLLSQTIPDSYYQSSRPDFYNDAVWPSTGADIGPSCTNPAKVRSDRSTPFQQPIPLDLEPTIFVPLAH